MLLLFGTLVHCIFGLSQVDTTTVESIKQLKQQNIGYVSLDGSDSNPGTLAKPFSTLQKCVDVVHSGECILRGGRYDRDKDVTSIPVGRNITIHGYQDDLESAVIDGSIIINTSWVLETKSRCIYRSSRLEKVPWQLWANDVLLTPARWPNARFSDYSVFDGASPNGSFAYSSRNSTSGVLYDDGKHQPSLADSGIDMTGTIVVMPFGTMGIQGSGALVTEHKIGSSSLKYKPPAGTAGKGHSNVPYFFEGHPKLLDSVEEWAYDETQHQLLVWLPKCADPNQQPPGFLRGKVRGFNMNITGSTVRLQKVTLFGTTFGASGASLVFDTVQMLYPTFSKRGIGNPSPVAETLMHNLKQLSVLNCTIFFADTVTGFNRFGDNSRFINNLWHGNGYASGSTATVDDHSSPKGMIFERNTVEYFNSFTGITPSFASVVRLNEFRFQGTETDGACIHVHIGPQNGILLTHNWAHHTKVKAFRFDRVNKANATWGVNGTITYNVAWNTGPLMIKGDHHTVLNNIVFDSPDKNEALWVMEYDPRKSWSIPGENAHTVMENNGADSIFNVSDKLPGIHKNNLGNTPIADQLSAPHQSDFRPKPGSTLYKNNIGAYQKNDTSYWIPGRQSYCATTPIPSDGAVGISTIVQLAWLEAYHANSHHLYFSNSTKLTHSVITYDSGVNVHHLESLQPNTTYYWRVDAIHEHDVVQRGEVWSFHT